MKASLSRRIVLAALFLLPALGRAADTATMSIIEEINGGYCSVGIDNVADFGLNPTSQARVAGARIRVACNAEEASHRFVLDTGLHYTAATGRRMASSEGKYIAYGIYTDNVGGPELGDSQIYGQASELYVGSAWTHQTYIALRQDPRYLPTGSFSDQVAVTIYY